jgi:hypothetical protein
VFAYFFARMAKVALDKKHPATVLQGQAATARFYFAKLLPETAGLIRTCRAGTEAADGDGRVAVLMDVEESLFYTKRTSERSLQRPRRFNKPRRPS